MRRIWLVRWQICRSERTVNNIVSSQSYGQWFLYGIWRCRWRERVRIRKRSRHARALSWCMQGTRINGLHACIYFAFLAKRIIISLMPFTFSFLIGNFAYNIDLMLYQLKFASSAGYSNSTIQECENHNIKKLLVLSLSSSTSYSAAIQTHNSTQG